MMIEITRFQKANNGSLSKHIMLKDGALKSIGSSCVMSAGTAERMKLASFQAFADCIHRLERHEAIALGALTPTVMKDKVNVVTKFRLNGLNGHAVDTIARTSEFIVYRSGEPALALIDVDSKDMSPA